MRLGWFLSKRTFPHRLRDGRLEPVPAVAVAQAVVVANNALGLHEVQAVGVALGL